MVPKKLFNFEAVFVIWSMLYFIRVQSCKSMIFMPGQNNTYLRNHVIQRLKTDTQPQCRVTCYLSDSPCTSYNYHQATETCEINDSDHIQNPDDLVTKSGYVYLSTDNGCQTRPCPSNSTCQANFEDEKQNYKCLCPSGFTGASCNTDIDECSEGTHNCSSDASCNNKRGSFDCKCNSGYHGDGQICTDIDECTSGSISCSQFGKCLNTKGSYQCVCNHGYEGDGFSCTDIDECTEGTSNCSSKSVCTNVPGSFTCSACIQGYTGDGFQCADIDECQSNIHNCPDHSTCSNNDGSFECPCDVGYKKNGLICELEPKIACENKQIQLACPSGKTLNIKWALYGRSSYEVCLHPSMRVPCGNEQNSLTRVSNLCQGKLSCSFSGSSSFFGGDPCGGYYKYTEVKYNCTS